ncbi:hypothetical protein [Eudoraea sp.]|uniref:hypothetical protein n=1 Tax=Eudoraea sp. TaxID=1979955 RepID=UPI003C70F288
MKLNKMKNPVNQLFTGFLVPFKGLFAEEEGLPSVCPAASHSANVTSNPCRIDILKLKIPFKRA